MASPLDNAITRNALRRLRSDLRGRYRIERLIGMGGMAAVYAGVHRNGHAVAIKILHEAHASDPEIERLFRREARLANKIGHPGVVPVIDDDVTDDGRIFLVMPLLRGDTVRARATRAGGKLTLSEVITISQATLETLAAAHERKIVHRDIKPENILVTLEGLVKVLDFGIGRFFETGDAASATRTGRAFGTPAFMAPEQALGRSREVDGRTDIWALGATMFTLLTGRFVHEADTATELAVLAATRPAPALETVAADVPPEIRRVVDRALSFSREDRWADASSMARALLEATESSGVVAAGLELPEQPPDTFEHDLLSTHVPLELAEQYRGVASDSVARLAIDETQIDRRSVTRTAYDEAPSLRRRWGLALLCVCAFGAAGVSAASLRSRRSSMPSVAGATRASITADISPNAATIASCAPPARNELAAGLQLWRDASQWEALPRFEAAVAADSACAAASVHYMMAATHTLPRRREHFRMAREHRSTLPARLQELLDALIPTVSDPPDHEEARRLAEALVQRSPLDPDAQRLYVRSLDNLGLLPATIAAADAAARVATTPDPWLDFFVGSAYLRAADSEKALVRFSRCLAVSPDSADCLMWRSIALACDGNCAEAESTLHHLVSVVPHSAQGWSFLGDVLLADTGDSRSARSAFEQRWLNMGNNAFGDAPTAVVAKLMDEYRMAVFDGDLETAVTISDTWIDAIGNVPGRFRAEALIAKGELLHEMAEEGRARSVACDALAESRTWPQDDMLDTAITLSRLCYLTGGMTSAEFVTLRGSWAAKVKPHPAQLWLEGYAGLPQFEASVPAPVEPGRLIEHESTSPIEYYGRTAFALLTLGRPEDALLHAKEAAKMCVGLRPLPLLHARLALAESYEANHMTHDACALYERLNHSLAKTATSSSRRMAAQHYFSLHCTSTLPSSEGH